jgi:hypothetical protein
MWTGIVDGGKGNPLRKTAVDGIGLLDPHRDQIVELVTQPVEIDTRHERESPVGFGRSDRRAHLREPKDA